MRLIDADAGVDLLRRMAQNYRNIGMHKYAEDLGIIAEMLDKPACFPTIDAVPVVHARWVPCGSDDYDAGMYYCSACKDERYFGDEVSTSEEAEKYAHFCPHCGAKMDGGENDGSDS